MSKGKLPYPRTFRNGAALNPRIQPLKLISREDYAFRCLLHFARVSLVTPRFSLLTMYLGFGLILFRFIHPLLRELCLILVPPISALSLGFDALASLMGHSN